MSGKKGKDTKHKGGTIRTPLSGHKRVGKELLPPFAMLPGNVTLTSWMNDRLPEMLWAALITAAFEREEALKVLRRIINFIAKHASAKHMHDLTLTGISKLEEPVRDELIAFMVWGSGSGNALTPLLLFSDLPGKETWNEHLPQGEPDVDLLAKAVGLCLWHQSQEATDCRWVKIMAQVVSGKMQIGKDMLDRFCGYPNVGDQRSVRPSIRAAEACPNPFADSDAVWPNSFWEQSWRATPCTGYDIDKTDDQLGPPVKEEYVANLYNALLDHWETSHSTTAIDAKHDAVFGSAFYAARIFKEIALTNICSGVLGRHAIRTLLEVRICLRFLISKSSDDMWKRWREYGAGQAKLNALRFDESAPPQYVSVESIRNIANEDMWEEFLKINIGAWHALDLRKVSEQVSLKDEYDAYYSWSSGYVHGSWGAIREACYNTCGNPLHRLHRFLDERPLQSTLSDSVVLVNKILADLDACYPKFEYRVSQPSDSTLSASAEG